MMLLRLFVFFVFIYSFSFSQSVRINEVAASNSIFLDEDGDTPDWIELYNYGADEISLNNWGLTDILDDNNPWTFPDITIDADEYLIIECYRQIDPTQHTRMFDDIMLKRYATALIKRQWGQNLSKFNGTAMLGGVTLNGPELFSSAVSEVQKLEEEIRLNYEEPPHMQQG